MDADAFAQVQAKELNNGRLAMIATMGKKSTHKMAIQFHIPTSYHSLTFQSFTFHFHQACLSKN